MNKPSLWLWALCLGSLLICGKAVAQGQPIGNGIYACDGAAQAGPCQPESDDGDSYSGASSGGYTDNDYAHAEPQWADRWGAIADNANGYAGIVEGESSKSEAERSAIEKCEIQGGGACRIAMVYYNQCAAVATGSQGVRLYRAPTEEQAKQSAMRECEDRQGKGACQLYYSGCSLPERIQ